MNPVRVPLLRPLRPAQWVAIDCAVTALLALTSAVIFREAAYLPGIPRWAAALVIAAGVLPAAFRRRWPRSVLALVVVSAAVATAMSTSPGPVLAVAFVIYLIPLRRPRREALWMLAGTLLAVGAGMAVFLSGPHMTRLPGAAAGLLRPGGHLLLCTPRDWSTTATPAEAWVAARSSMRTMTSPFCTRSPTSKRMSTMRPAICAETVDWRTASTIASAVNVSSTSRSSAGADARGGARAGSAPGTPPPHAASPRSAAIAAPAALTRGELSRSSRPRGAASARAGRIA